MYIRTFMVQDISTPLGSLDVIEADSSSLSIVILGLEKNTALYDYAQFLLAYLRGQTDELKKWIAKYSVPQKENSFESIVSYLMEMRFAVRTLRTCAKVKPHSDDLLWCGEMTFVKAMYFEIQNDDIIAEKLYYDSQRLLFTANAKRKASRAFHNAIACRSRIEPKRRLIPEYQEAIRLAKDAGETGTTAAALNNLSREFQLMKAHHIALEYSNEAVLLLKDSAYGTYTFYMALCHRCQLNLELGRIRAALIDYEEASGAEFPEIKNSLKVIREWMDERGIQTTTEEIKKEKLSHIPYTWLEREEQGLLDDGAGLSDLQAQLISLLSKGPQNRYDLALALWGEKEDFFHLDNRLKQLIHRLRKKDPNIIGFLDGRYFLIDNASGEKSAELIELSP